MEAGTNSSYCNRNLIQDFKTLNQDEGTCGRLPAHGFRVVNEGIFFISIANINQVLDTVRFLWSGTLRVGGWGVTMAVIWRNQIAKIQFSNDTYKFFLQPFYNSSYLIISHALVRFTVPHRDFLLWRKRNSSAVVVVYEDASE